jgi:hypothetical protein
MSVKITVNGEQVKIPLPHNVTLRKQNPKCNEKGCLCSLYGTQKVCWNLSLLISDGKNLDLGEIRACKLNADYPKIKIEG